MKNKKKIAGIIRVIAGTVLILLAGWFLYYVGSGKEEKGQEESQWAAESNPDIKAGEVLVSETGTLKLYFAEDTSQIRVEDKTTGQVWRSNPENAGEDSLASGLNKTNLLSQLIVEYIDSQGSLFVVNNYVGSVKDAAYEYRIADSGVYVTYRFSDGGFEVPVYYGLKEDCFTARVLCDDIKLHKEYQITSIRLLPYMGCGNTEDKGYLMVPDGSGSLIYFNNDKQEYVSYSQPVYGRDNALSTLAKTEVKESATLPVFGIKKNDYAMFGIITKGEFQANIEAEVSRKSSSNNIAYTKVRLKESDTNKLFANTGNEKTTILWSEQSSNFPEYEVCYYFLPKDSTYTDMALRYQEYLVKEKGMAAKKEEQTEGTRVNVEFIGAIEKTATFLGIPYETIQPLTSYKEVLKLAGELTAESEIALSVQYSGFLKDGLKSKLPGTIRFDRRLGGKASFMETKKGLAGIQADFYPAFDLVTMYKTGGGYYKTDVARSVYRSPAYQYEYLLSTGNQDPSVRPAYLLAPEKLKGLSESFLKSLGKNGLTSISVAGLSDTVYSNFRKNGMSRKEAGEAEEEILKNLSEETDSLMLKGALGFALPYADAIANTSVESSSFDVEDESIPFYQIVMSGYAKLYSEPVNFKGNQKDYLLKLAETGVSPSYLLMAEDSSVLMNTDYDYLYAASFGDWKEDIHKTAEWMKPLAAVYEQRITGHEKLTEGVYRTTYENGISVYTNYNDEAVTVRGITVPARDFLVKDGE